MIVTFLIYVVIFILNALQLLLSGITFLIPHQIPDAFNLIFSYARMGDGIFPMSDALLAILTVVQVWVFMYLVKVILFGYALIPWLGKHVELPDHSGQAIQQHRRFEKIMGGKGINTRNYQRKK